MESRRLGRLLKRALVTAAEAMRALGSPADGGSAAVPDAIITGTGLGCIENTELLLKQMCCEGDDTLKPTNFMQSTHNTIGSLIAINTRCHGYNSTYSHKAVSFDTALLDAFMQLRLGDIGTALVTGNDEMTPSYFTILRRAGYLGQPGQCPASEASVAMLLSTEAGDALCQLSDVQLVCSSAPLTSHPHTPHPTPLTSHPSPLTSHPTPLTPHPTRGCHPRRHQRQRGKRPFLLQSYPLSARRPLAPLQAPLWRMLQQLGFGALCRRPHHRQRGSARLYALRRPPSAAARQPHPRCQPQCGHLLQLRHPL